MLFKLNPKLPCQVIITGSQERLALTKRGVMFNMNTIMGHRQNILYVLIIAVFSISLYVNTLTNGLVYDDEFTIVNNAAIKDLRNLPVLFQKKYLELAGEMSYRPVVTLSYFLDYAVFRLNPWGFHLTNIFLHALNGMMLYFFLLSLIKEKEIGGLSSVNLRVCHLSCNSLPFMASLLFVSHPILTEAVNAVSFREELLVFFFYIAALNSYILERRSPSRLLYAVSCLLYFFALLSKEMAITLPLIIYCYERVYCDTRKERLRSTLFRRVWGYVAIFLIYACLRFILFYNPETENYAGWGIDERLLTIPWLLLSYLKLILLPIALSAIYEIAPIKSLAFPFLIALSVITLFLYTAFAVRKTEKGMTFGLLFFAVTLIPVYNIYPITHPFADRYLYLPLAGIIIFFMSAAHLSVDKLKHRTSLPAFYIATLCMFSLLVIGRSKVWENDFSLWADSVKKMPDSNLAHTNFGIALVNQGRFDEGIKEFKTALSMKPRYPIAYTHNELGYAYYRTGKIDAAEREFYIALVLNPNYSTAYNNLGIVHAYQGRGEEAIKDFEKALKSKPFDPMFHFNLGFAYAKNGQINNAVQQYRAFLNLKPDALPAREALEALLKESGNQKIEH